MQNEILTNSLSEISPEIQYGNPYLLQLHTECKQIQEFLKQTADLRNPDSLVERLNAISVYVARLAEMLFQVKTMKNLATRQVQEDNIGYFEKLGVMEKTKVVNNLILEFSAVTDQVELAYASAKDICRSLLTQISYIKQQITLL